MRPVDVTKGKVDQIFNRMYGKHFANFEIKPKFADKEPVRISSAKSVFDKGYLPNWTDEVFKVTDVVNHPKKVYKIEDLDGENVKGTFYPEELQSVTYDFPKRHIVDKIIKNRKRKSLSEVFIKWKGYPSRYNTWIPEADLGKYAEGIE